MSLSLKVLTPIKWYQNMIRQPVCSSSVLYSLKILSMHFNSLFSEITYLCHILILTGNLVCVRSYLCTRLEMNKYSYRHNDKENIATSPVGSQWSRW